MCQCFYQQYYNTQNEQVQELGVEYATSPLHLLKSAPQFKKYCHQYKVAQKNPDGLIISEFQQIFNKMDKAQVYYCMDYILCEQNLISFTYLLNEFFIRKTFQTIKNAFDIELQMKEEQPKSRTDIATELFGMELLTKLTELTKLDDLEKPEQIDKKVIKYVLQCDLSQPEFSTLISGIKDRWNKQILWRNYYALNIQYKQKILTFQKLPKYVFVHASRFGYAPAKQQWLQIELYQHKKSYHKVRYGRIIDLYELCDENLKQKLYFGRQERSPIFLKYNAYRRYSKFRKSISNVEDYSENQILYMFFDSILYQQKRFHNFFFQFLKNSKPTGQYRMVVVVIHKGDYYHPVNPSHRHDCIGQFQTFAYQNGQKWIRYHKAQVQYVSIYDVMDEKYWGKEGQFTPVLFLYRQINMRYMIVQEKDDKKSQKTQSKKEETRK